MRDIINATIGADHFLRCPTYVLARNGEGLTPCLSITIPDGLLRFWAYIDFKKANGEKFKTPRLDVSEGKIIYNIDGSVLDTEGELEVQVVFQNAEGEIWKTYVKEFAVRYSINATDDIPDKEDFITEAQKTLDEAMAIATSVEERANAGEFNGKDGADGKDGENGKDAVTDQHFDHTSPNAQSGIAIEERLKSKVLLDVTLTEEQAGASSVKVAIPNHELLEKAKQWNIRLMCPYTEAINANTVWYNCNIVSGKSGIGGITIANGYNAAFASSSNKAFWYITAFNTQHATREGASGSVISYYQQVSPWAEQSSANSGTNARSNLYCYSSGLFVEDNTVYLEFNNGSNFIFEAGTMIYLEVIL